VHDDRECEMGKKVIVIDDDKNAVKFLSALLSENGYETLAAYDGREGLEMIESNKVDLIVLDVMMPKKTGFVLFKQLKKKDEYKDIPILMLTAIAASLMELDAEKEDTFERPYDSLRESLRKAIQEMRQNGEVKPDMFVDKPVDPETFIEKVRKLIGD
jgi:CheY-like chemotaxis protein